MPYPLSKLPYGLRCRLTELTTPVERYNLQIAAGNLSICPLKLQHIQKSCYNPTFSSENGMIVLLDDTTTITFVEDTLIMCENTISMTGLSLEDLTSKVFGHILFRNAVLMLNDCEFSKTFFFTLRSIFSDWCAIDFYSNTNNILNFNDVLTFFPNLWSISTHCRINNTWINDIVQLGIRSLSDLTLFFNHPLAKFEKFWAQDLLSLLKAQRSGFSLSIEVTDDTKEFERFFRELKQFMDRNEILFQQSSSIGDVFIVKYPTRLNVVYSSNSGTQGRSRDESSIFNEAKVLPKIEVTASSREKQGPPL
uniref:FBA_2 domain-containing protein n=1 Tax=Panagrellus redivivus TaxID=6233 RepID=A0A7E4ZQM5_PANRE